MRHHVLVLCSLLLIRSWSSEVDSNHPGRTSVEHASHPLIARLQSAFEAHLGRTNHSRSAVPAFHQVATLISKELHATHDPLHPSPHVSAIGYPLTVTESLALKAGVLQRLDKRIDNDTEACQLLIRLGALVAAHGASDPEVREFYSSVQYFGTSGSVPLLDWGWLNEFFGTIETFGGLHRGVHAYRKVPRGVGGGYDFSFAVHPLPDNITIGLLADWGCGTPESAAVLAALKTQRPDLVLHLGDVYYSGTEEEQREFLLNPIRQQLNHSNLYLIPGNHDYYSSGEGLLRIVDELGLQEASFFVLRGSSWQIVALDTAILDTWNLLLPGTRGTMPFLPEDQLAWALHQLDVGHRLRLKTIVVSHHQFFSRHESLGAANAVLEELATLPDQLHGTFDPQSWRTPSSSLPGHLPPDVIPAANTRLLGQFNQSYRESASAFYWGHEHGHSVFAPYASIQRGRLIGNGCIPVCTDTDLYAVNNGTQGRPWGGHPELVAGERTGQGDRFWNMGFVTVELSGGSARAQHFEVQFNYSRGGEATTRMFFQEDY